VAGKQKSHGNVALETKSCISAAPKETTETWFLKTKPHKVVFKNEKPHFCGFLLKTIGRGGGIRTRDPLHPMRTRPA
jgi:hypothetical protein